MIFILELISSFIAGMFLARLPVCIQKKSSLGRNKVEWSVNMLYFTRDMETQASTVRIIFPQAQEAFFCLVLFYFIFF